MTHLPASCCALAPARWSALYGSLLQDVLDVVEGEEEVGRGRGGRGGHDRACAGGGGADGVAPDGAERGRDAAENGSGYRGGHITASVCKADDEG